MGQFAIENGDAQAVLRFDTPANFDSIDISFAVDMDGSDTAVKLLDIRYGLRHCGADVTFDKKPSLAFCFSLS